MAYLRMIEIVYQFKYLSVETIWKQQKRDKQTPTYLPSYPVISAQMKLVIYLL